MDKETLSNYGWIVICVLVLAVMIALAGPFGNFISDAVKSTTQGLFDVNQNALDAAGIEIEEQTFWVSETNSAKIYYDRVYASPVGGAGIWHRDGSVEFYFINFPEQNYVVPAGLIKIEGNKLSHPDLLFDDGRDNEYYANEDGTVVKYTVYSYSFSNGVATSKSYVGQVDCTLTEYSSIEEWYNATYNS